MQIFNYYLYIIYLMVHSNKGDRLPNIVKTIFVYSNTTNYISVICREVPYITTPTTFQFLKPPT